MTELASREQLSVVGDHIGAHEQIANALDDIQHVQEAFGSRLVQSHMIHYENFYVRYFSYRRSLLHRSNDFWLASPPLADNPERNSSAFTVNFNFKGQGFELNASHYASPILTRRPVLEAKELERIQDPQSPSRQAAQYASYSPEELSSSYRQYLLPFTIAANAVHHFVYDRYK